MSLSFKLPLPPHPSYIRLGKSPPSEVGLQPLETVCRSKEKQLQPQHADDYKIKFAPTLSSQLCVDTKAVLLKEHAPSLKFILAAKGNKLTVTIYTLALHTSRES